MLDSQFQTLAREMATRDHEAQPYPLTDTVFSVTKHEVAGRLETLDVDPTRKVLGRRWAYPHLDSA
jgi:hypothetical protein